MSDQHNQKPSDARPEPEVEQHVYDDIVELDNPIPRWFTALFYSTVVAGVLYFGYYEMGSGPGSLAEYERQAAALERTSLSEAARTPPATEDELVALARDPASRLAGQQVYQSKCLACHGTQAQGGIGPNLIDRYWLHGGRMTEIVRTISVGVLDKGMPPWGSILSRTEVHGVAAYIRSLQGKTAPGAKAPQGQLTDAGGA